MQLLVEIKRTHLKARNMARARGKDKVKTLKSLGKF